MRIFYRRPFAFACCVFALVSLFAFKWSATGKIVLMISLAVFLVPMAYLLFSRSRRWMLPVLCSFMAFLAILLSYLYFNVNYRNYQMMVGNSYRIEGVVEEEGSSYSGYLLKVDSVDGERAHFSAKLYFSEETGLKIGEKISCFAEAIPFESEGDYDAERSALSDGLVLAFRCQTVDDYLVIGDASKRISVILNRWNAALSERLRAAVGGEEGAVAEALLLGNKSDLSKELTLDFRRAGISHLLALSGLHISIVVAFFEYFMRGCLIFKKFRLPILFPVMILYLFLTGAHISTLRAVLMASFGYFAFFLMEELDLFTALCETLFLIIFFIPYSVLDVSMWMSYLATGSIIIFSPLIKDALKWFKRFGLPKWCNRIFYVLVSAIWVGMVANFALVLLTSCLYGTVSLTSIPATLLLSIPITVALSLSIVTLVVPSVGTILHPIFGAILKICRYCADLPGVLVNTEDGIIRILLILFTVLLLFFAVASVKKARFYLLLPLSFVLILTLACSMRDFSGERLFSESETDSVSMTGGVVTAVAKRADLSSAVYALYDDVLEVRGTEIHDLYFTGYENKETYYLSKLCGYIRIRNLHLPMPADETEAAISLRVEEEAKRHRITVIYDSETEDTP